MPSPRGLRPLALGFPVHLPPPLPCPLRLPAFLLAARTGSGVSPLSHPRPGLQHGLHRPLARQSQEPLPAEAPAVSGGPCWCLARGHSLEGKGSQGRGHWQSHRTCPCPCPLPGLQSTPCTRHAIFHCPEFHTLLVRTRLPLAQHPLPVLSPQPGDGASPQAQGKPALRSAGLCCGWDVAEAAVCLLFSCWFTPLVALSSCSSAERFSQTRESEWELDPPPAPITYLATGSTHSPEPGRPARSLCLSLTSAPSWTREHQVSRQGHLAMRACFLLTPDVCAGHWADECSLST